MTGTLLLSIFALLVAGFSAFKLADRAKPAPSNQAIPISPVVPKEKSSVAQRFNITQVVINEHGPIFEEVIIALQAAFDDLNIPCTRTENVLVDDAINIVIGHVMFVSGDVARALSGKRYVLYQMEQLDVDSGHLPNFPEYVELLKNALCVWDYSETNIERMRQLDVPRGIHIPTGFHRAIEVMRHEQPKTHDVVFYGAMTPRRNAIIRALTERGMAVNVLFGCYGAERDAAIMRAKIVLNIHAMAIKTLEEVRLSYLLANCCFVISEEADHNPYGAGVVFCPYDQLVETCERYLQAGDDQRQRIAEIGYQAIREFDYTSHVKLAVEKTVAWADS